MNSLRDGTFASANDAKLVDALRSGDEKAFAELVRRHHQSMLRVARGYVRSESSAEDVVQETWISVMKGVDRFEGRSSVATWLYRILVNLARTAGTKESRIVPIDALGSVPSVEASRFDDGGMWTQPPIPFVDLIDGTMVDADALKAIREAIAHLPDPHQAVVTLRDVEGLSSVETAELLEMSVGNVRVVLHRARAQIRSAIESTVRAGEQ